MFSMEKDALEFLIRPGKGKLGYVYSPGNEERLPLVMFCGGYHSDMSGTKATYFESQCRARGQSYLRFDYSGHGVSEGRFEDGTIGQWAQDTEDMIRHMTQGGRKILLIGSSMGGWLALLMARRVPEKLCALIGIAAAPDFTQDIYEQRLSAAQRQAVEKQGWIEVPNHYGAPPYHFTKAFFEDGRRHAVLSEPLRVDFPVHLFQGGLDEDVPPSTPARIQAMLHAPGIAVTLIEDGDHRLSRPQDLSLMDRMIEDLSRA